MQTEMVILIVSDCQCLTIPFPFGASVESPIPSSYYAVFPDPCLHTHARAPVLSTSLYDNTVRWYENTACRHGTYGTKGSAPCILCAGGRFGTFQGLGAEAGSNCSGACPVGRYSLPGASVCSLCEPGRFGNTTGLSSSSCSGNCSAGYACAAGSTNATASVCSPGTYSLAGAGVCTVCSPGLYGATAALSSPTCSGPCPAGTFGAIPGVVSPSCSGPCRAGHACPAGSTNDTTALCAPGTYSLSGAGTCSACAPGLFGASSGMTTADCSGPCDPGRYGGNAGLATPQCTADCSAGHACPAGSTSDTAVVCPRGTFSLAGAAACTPCAPGLYGSTPALTAPQCSGPCDAGRYGVVPGLASPSCTGPCDAGYACPAGSILPTTMPCEAGRYSMGGAGTCTACAAGKHSPDVARPSACTMDCQPGLYCLAGSAAPAPCGPGRWGNTSGLQTSACSGVCPMGSFCLPASVIPSLCPPGRFGATSGAENSSCSGACAAGYVCAAGSVTSTAAPCGDASVYCPAGSGLPLGVPLGWFSTPDDVDSDPAYRTGASTCVAGEYCVGGVRRDCPGGTYSGSAGQTTCDQCLAGRCMPAFTVFPDLLHTCHV
jgi:hypothetical protein